MARKDYDIPTTQSGWEQYWIFRIRSDRQLQ